MDEPLNAGSSNPSVAPESSPSRFDQKELHDLLCGLSDELCRPFASLRTGFDLILGDGPSRFTSAQKEHVSTMRTLCDELLSLTRSYQDYAEVIRGERSPSLGTFSIRALVQEIDRSFGPIARSKNLDWCVETIQGDALVVTDASRCQQIFAAVLSNAVKFTPAGGSIQVSGSADEDSWSVVVRDDGPGIAPGYQDRIFEPFYRLGRDEHSSAEGSGLGLSICQELVTQLQGCIEFESDEGQGTEVSVRFPRKPLSR